MSNQSGIEASEELQTAFRQFQAGSHRALVLEIVNESCEPGKLIEGGSSFEGDFAHVQKHLAHNKAAYIVYRTDEDDGSLIFISFVPDSAPVRSKMLYASSTNTIHRQLGGGTTFGTTIFWTELDEVSDKGWKAHVAHEQASAPVTEEERSLQDVLQSEADQVLGTGGRKSELHRLHIGSASSASTGLALAEDDAVHSALKQLHASEQATAVTLHIDLATERVVVGKQGEVDAAGLADSFISTSQPQYTLFKHVDGPDHSVVFIYTCPSGSKIKERMVYASNRESVVSSARKVLKVAKVVEATDGSDITAEFISEQVYPETSSGGSSGTASAASTPRPGFARPKRPGRR